MIGGENFSMQACIYDFGRKLGHGHVGKEWREGMKLS